MVGRLNLKVDEDLLFQRTMWRIEQFNLLLLVFRLAGRRTLARIPGSNGWIESNMRFLKRAGEFQ